ncbi:KAT8 regulatory NSL complex subunit 2 isoform X2 [Cotesia glomerata]|uniref:KAT8 regulatory NSL complex subunit 2 isoform X2 n=1 Tax=Cotesia glomerata TaxID=32391 RepID=UPI001D0095E4|nr:KAT8 regulatory NSL complex subunit 2 isoform X2 [Cotesia glomerata]
MFRVPKTMPTVTTTSIVSSSLSSSSSLFSSSSSSSSSLSSSLSSSSSSSSSSSTSSLSSSSSSPQLLMTSSLSNNKIKKKCCYGPYDCTQQCLDNYNYCLRHILEDPNAPYKQCAFIYNANGRKCCNPNSVDTAYCSEHTRRAQLARIKSTSKHMFPQTPEGLLLNLQHYTKQNLNNGTIVNGEITEKSEFLDPFTDVDAMKVNASGCDILDYGSSSDSDVEPTVPSESLRGTYLDDSDNESFHSPQEDPLKHAGVFTAEEVIYIAREKLIRLQALYIDQFKRLQYTLREKRRKYLHALKKEKETLCSVHDQGKETAREKKIYEKLKALNRYHRRSGVEAILYKKSIDRRSKSTEGAVLKTPNIPKCIFTEGGVKCGERTLPSAKHCRKHILKDQNQVLFKACGAIRADIECHEPVPVIFDSNCVFHMDLPSFCKVEPMKFNSAIPLMEIDTIQQENGEVDPDDDVAGLMREMNDSLTSNNKKLDTSYNESINSEASTDTAPHSDDKDDAMSM